MNINDSNSNTLNKNKPKYDKKYNLVSK